MQGLRSRRAPSAEAGSRVRAEQGDQGRPRRARSRLAFSTVLSAVTCSPFPIRALGVLHPAQALGLVLPLRKQHPSPPSGELGWVTCFSPWNPSCQF